MSMRLSVMVMGLCLAMSASIARADVYKWTDADGHVHYGDLPKQGAEKVNTGPTNGEASVDDKDTDVDKQKQKHAEECGRKRDQLTNYSKAARIVETDSLGNEKEFNADDRQKLIDRTQKQIADGCGDVPATNAAPTPPAPAGGGQAR